MFGRLKLPLGTEEAILVPKSAITHIGQLSMIYVAHDNRMERRNVQLGRELGDQIQILAGLRSGETIIVRNSPESGASQRNSH
jgi:multidrug efflux pump subunit AcrA (membrane-fusion protein)